MSFIKTGSGLEYRDDLVGEGVEAGTGAPSVEVHYTGWLKNADGTTGQKFDSSRDHGEPLVFPLGAGYVIAGWDEGVKGMKVGGKRTLHIPSHLAYGSSGAGDVIPPDANLIFEVELLKA